MGDWALKSTHGYSVIPFLFNGQLIPQKTVTADIDVAGVLGYAFFFLYENAISINVRDGYLVLNGDNLQCELESELPSVFRVTLNETVIVPPNSEIVVQGKIKKGSVN